MPSSYTANLRLTLPADGELVGTWGQVVNNGITALIETAISGRLVKALPDADYTLTTANGAADEARNVVLHFTGTLTATRNVICPAVNKNYLVSNATNQSIVFKTSAGSGITVPSGARMPVVCDGTNVIDAFTRVNATASNADNLGGVPAASYALTSALGNYVAKTGDTMTGALINTSTVKVGNGAAGNSARLMVNTLSGTAAGIQLFQDGNESWIMQNPAGSTALTFANSGAERMRLAGDGSVLIGTTGVYSGFASRLTLNFAGIGSQFGLTLATPDTSATLSRGLSFLQGGNASGGGTLSEVGNVSFNSDGLYLNGSPSLVLRTNGAERIRVDSGGGVTVGGTLSLSRQDTSAEGGQINFSRASDNSSAWALDVIGSGSAPDFRFINIGGGSTVPLILTGTGDVGVGTTGPTQRLDVRGNILSLVGAGGTLLLGDSNNTVGLRSIPTGGDSALGFYTQALSGNSERMRIDASGDVGIGGASSSGWRLQVNASPVAATGNATALRLRNTSDGGVSVLFDNAAGVLARLSAAVTGTGVGTDDGVLTFETSINGSLTERMRIDSAGNVGIGCTPVGSNRLLEVGNSARAVTYVRNVSQTAGSAWYESLAAGFDTLFVGVNNSGGALNGVPNAMGGVVMAGANPLVFGTSATERMRINGAGLVSIGTTTAGGQLTIGGAQELIRLINDAAYIGFFNSAGGSRSGYIQSNTSGPFMIVQEQAQLMQFWVNGAARADITSGGVLRYGGIEVGYRGLPTASVASGAFAASDNGKRVKATAGVTIPNSVMTDGDIVHVLNTTGSAITITKSITTAYNKNTGTALGATFTLAARGSMTIEFTGSTECYVGGNIS